MTLTRPELQPQFEQLLNTTLANQEALQDRIAQRDKLESTLSKDYAWRYIAQTRDTSDKAAQESYQDFIQTIYPEWIARSDTLGRKLVASPGSDQLAPQYHNYLRKIKSSLELFREENIALMSKEEEIKAQFAKIAGAMTIRYQGQELTMQEAADFLKSPDRSVRKEVFELMEERRKTDSNRLDDVLSQLIGIRTQIARNCGFESYRQYKFAFRYDYSPGQITQFHESIRQVIVPLGKKIFDKRKKLLGLDILKPYDFDAPMFGEVNNEYFSSTQDMIAKLSQLLQEMDPEFSSFISDMQTQGNVDLETRKNKAPGGYNYPLSGTPYSFIFMNALRDNYGRFTRAHEAGHAIHHFLTSHYELDIFRDTPSELAEVASMSMELFTLEDLDAIGLDRTQIKVALEDKLSKDILFFAYMSQIDLFQDRLYDNPEHNSEQRHVKRRELNALYPYSLRIGESDARAGEYESYLQTFWQRQMHIFEVPFYYIEYGIASLASLQLYNQWKKDRRQAIANYKKILSAGYIHSIPDTMKLGGVEFNLSKDFFALLIQGIADEYEKLF